MFVSGDVKQNFGIIIEWIIELPLLEIILLEDYRAEILGVGSSSEQNNAKGFQGKIWPLTIPFINEMFGSVLDRVY